VDEAAAGDELRLRPGTYYENISVAGKGMTIRSMNPDDPAVVAATIIDGGGDNAVVTCSGASGAGLMLNGLTVTNGTSGIYCSGATLTMTGCIIAGNHLAGVKLWSASHLTAAGCIVAGNGGAGVEMWSEKTGRFNPYNYATITNCTVTENGRGGIWGGKPTIANSIFWNNEGDEVTGDTVVATYSDVQGGLPGQGNIDSDPYFVRAGSWSGGAWVQGDYHLKGKGARWDAKAGAWVSDETTSPCIDAGDPLSPLGAEPGTAPGVASANARIDMGVYGGTAQASLAP
jgi:hypothetical protein